MTIPALLQLARRHLRPDTRTGWFTVYVSGLELLLLLLEYGLKLLGAREASASLAVWNRLLWLLLGCLFVFLSVRWFRNAILWRLRNRLIVTYLFIGGVPVVLVGLMALISGYFISGQFATFLTLSQVHARLDELQYANSASAQQVAHRYKDKEPVLPKEKLDEVVFPGRTIEVLPGAQAPQWLKNAFTGLVIDKEKIYLRAAEKVDAQGGQSLLVISSVPVDQNLVGQIAHGLGPLTLYVPTRGPGGTSNMPIKPGVGVQISGKSQEISAGTLPEPQFRGDRALSYYALIQPTLWETGEAGEATTTVMTGFVRFSTLYSRLSLSVNEWTNILRLSLTFLAGLFAMIVLIALVIGIRLTRTITRSVANLYTATEHINHGDFTHRIEVEERDQLATLQVAFNSMTESLEKLIAEQKEKERLQSELAIAQEVQAQLFPKATAGTGTLELCGICRPARMVSGDYYDFLYYGGEQLGIAIGDISGKGISAALLMAAIHSAIRYEQEQLVSVAAESASLKTAISGSVALAARTAPPQSPSGMLWLLNHHLYRTTQPEKYATLFLGFYDGHTGRITYSNAGHLPPIILGEDGSVRRLDEGGMVVGLFDNAQYQERTVQLKPTDLLIAFSDGITEPENEFGEFGEDRLIETIETHRNLPLDRIADQVMAAVQDWIGSAEQPDDMTIVLARRRK
jgi:sigma-B regulation protein RsbU (phosphoserine phosphatase)